MATILYLLLCCACDSQAPPTTTNTLALEECDPDSLVKIREILSAEGEKIWPPSGIKTTGRGNIYEAIELNLTNYCNQTLLLADGFHPARVILPKLTKYDTWKLEIPWNLPRVDLSLVFKAKMGITRVDISVLPADQVYRQLFVHRIKEQRF
ncbi:MAG: hypothetical protein VYA34_15085 [Myxococcota bacterium]|nr:hypothetical protein [Myxococcota bacterium]